MKEKILTRRYSDAYMKVVKEALGVERAVKEFKNFRRIIYDNPSVVKFLKSPEMAYAEKCAFIDGVLGDKFSLDIKNFIKFLIEKERINLIEDIADYIRVNYSKKGSVEAVLKTTFPLDLPVIQEIKQRLEKKFDTTINMYLELEPELLGGIKVSIKNTVIDASIRRRLDDMREKLKTVKVV